jgi:hypothetical protein
MPALELDCRASRSDEGGGQVEIRIDWRFPEAVCNLSKDYLRRVPVENSL